VCIQKLNKIHYEKYGFQLASGKVIIQLGAAIYNS
jgi:hypothetical protein